MNIEHKDTVDLNNVDSDMAPVTNDNNRAEFTDKYPFPSDSPYFNNNLLLSKLYSERIARHPHLKHQPN